MPRIKYITPKNVPPPNMVKEMFDRYQKAGKVSSAELGRRLGSNPSTLRSKKSLGNWSAQEIADWCRALGITDPEEIGRAILGTGR